jgi:hypothetical protein
MWAEATLGKEADLKPCCSINIDTISKRVFKKNQN